jgi:hypothetical protein
MMVNSSLGSGVGALVEYLKSRQRYELLAWMAQRSPNERVAHLILAGGVDNEEVLRVIIGWWYLGPEDQLRLALLVDPYSSFAEVVLDSLTEGGCKLARRALVLRRSGRHPARALKALEVYTAAGSVGAGTFRERIADDRKRELPRLLSGAYNANEIKDLFAIDGVLSGELSQGLGEAQSEESFRTWMLFLSLAANDQDVRVADVIKSARVLARSECVPVV